MKDETFFLFLIGSKVGKLILTQLFFLFLFLCTNSEQQVQLAINKPIDE